MLCCYGTDGGALFQVYRGTERLTDSITPSFWGRYDKVVCVGSLSKAFGLPGLRLGWLVASPSLVEQVCSLYLYIDQVSHSTDNAWVQRAHQGSY